MRKKIEKQHTNPIKLIIHEVFKCNCFFFLLFSVSLILLDTPPHNI